MTATKNLTAELMAAVTTNDGKNLFPRLKALGILETCGRCCGSGHYSYNAMTGTTCFGCNGAGVKMPKVTKELVAEAKKLWTPEFKANYLAEVKRVAECKKLVENASTMYARSVVRAEWERVAKTMPFQGWIEQHEAMERDHPELTAKREALCTIEDKMKKVVKNVYNGFTWVGKNRVPADFKKLAAELEPLFAEYAAIDKL